MFQPEPAKDVDASEEEKKLENANVEEPVDVKNAQDQEKDDQFREVEEAEGSPGKCGPSLLRSCVECCRRFKRDHRCQHRDRYHHCADRRQCY